jgi:hypothetical protein
MVVPERRESGRSSEESENGLASNAAPGQGAVLPELRSAVYLCNSPWVTQLLRQGEAKMFKKYSQMKLADEKGGVAEAEPEGQRVPGFDTEKPN